MTRDNNDLAESLVTAVSQRRAIAPLTEARDLTVAQAYDVQDAALKRLDPSSPRTVAKLGLTSRAKQEQMSVHEPIYGWFISGSAVDLGVPLDLSTLIQPRAEPEIAFLTSEELAGPDVTATEVLAVTSGVMPALDILDSRFAGYKFTLPDVVADNASAARFMVGAPMPADELDLGLVGCILERNDELVDTAAGAAVLGHPAAAVAWFVRKLAERGQVLPAGSIVLSGALTAAIPLAPGDVVRVTLDGIGKVELRCT